MIGDFLDDPRIVNPEGPENPSSAADKSTADTRELPSSDLPAGRARASQKGRSGGQPGNQNARKHGVYPLKKLLSVRGLSAIDGRSEVARALREKREELEAHVGADRLSEPRRILIEQIIRRILFLESIDTWLLDQPSLVNKRKRSIIPALVEREKLAAGLVRDLEALGLDRVAKTVPDLAEYLSQRERDGTAGA